MSSPWDTEMLRLSVARLTTPLTRSGAPERAEHLYDLLSEAAARSDDDHHQLTILRVDANDHATLAAAQACGYRVTETQVAYLNDGHDDPPPIVAPGLRVTDHPATEISEVVPPWVVATFQDAIERWATSHFHADPRISPDSTRNLYRTWVRNLLTGAHGDHVVLAWHDDEIVGYQGLALLGGLAERRGVTVLDVSLAQSLLPGRRVHETIAGRAATLADRGYPLTQYVTQSDNLPTLRSLDVTRRLRIMRCRVTLHRWRDG